MAFLDFLERCLTWDASDRIKPSEALNHPFITNTRFIPQSVNLYKAKNENLEMVKASKLGLARAKYVSNPNIEQYSSKKSHIDSSIRSELRTQGSLRGSNRLPSVATLGRLGTQISSVISKGRNIVSGKKEHTLPPISYNPNIESTIIDSPFNSKSKPKTVQNNFSSARFKVFFYSE